MKKMTSLACIIVILSGILLSGCGGSGSTEADHSGPRRNSTPQVLTPSADGTVVYQNDVAAIDASNTSQGYVMVNYNGSCEKVRLQITGPDQNCYTYLITEHGNYTAFPLTAGNGSYSIQVMENIGGDSYVLSLEQTVDAVKKGSELAEDTWTDLEVVQNIYNFVIKNISYDEEKAQNVSYGYLPNVDDTLASGTGICFDYAALMTAMLRSQNIPTKLEVGYSGDTYHAWISTYVDDKGWVDNIIEFDGDSWQIMDPTLGANNDSKSVKKYVGDGSHYVVKYTY